MDTNLSKTKNYYQKNSYLTKIDTPRHSFPPPHDPCPRIAPQETPGPTASGVSRALCGSSQCQAGEASSRSLEHTPRLAAAGSRAWAAAARRRARAAAARSALTAARAVMDPSWAVLLL